MRFLESAIDTINKELILLAPGHGRSCPPFWPAQLDQNRYEEFLDGLQRLRGQVYLEDGAIEEWQLTADGRHVQEADRQSWHVLALDEHGELCGCARFRHYAGPVGFRQLGVRNSAIAQCRHWGASLRAAVESEIADARRRGLAFAEVGGWAISAEKRFTTEAIRMVLATFGLAQLLGGCVGLTTATVRHRSSAILRRLGGRSLTVVNSELPSYYDPQYRCQMEVLRFDSSEPDRAYRRSILRLEECLPAVSVFAEPCTAVVRRPAIAAPVPVFVARPSFARLLPEGQPA